MPVVLAVDVGRAQANRMFLIHMVQVGVGRQVMNDGDVAVDGDIGV